MVLVSDEQIIKVLRQYNSWWRIPSAIQEETKPQKRLAYYEALKMLKHKTIRRFVVLSGVRRVGKTTILYQIIENLLQEGVNPKNILYATFDMSYQSTKPSIRWKVLVIFSLMKYNTRTTGNYG